MNPEAERKTQIRVGVFTLIGLLLIGSMVTYFGRLGEGLQRFYEIEVNYPNASGLLRGADVLMAGAKVGKVATGPEVLPTGEGVSVRLKIHQGVEIPSNSLFTIGSSGLLGDRFVDVAMPPLDQQEVPLKPGESTWGERETGFGELADQGGQMLAEVREAVQRISTVLERLDKELLTPETLEAIGVSVENFRKTSDSLQQSAQGLDGMISEISEKAGVFLEEATAVASEGKAAMQTANAAAEEGKSLMLAATATAEEFERTAGDVRRIVRETREGRGALGLLLADQETSDNLRALIANMRTRGILFYRDRYDEATREEQSPREPRSPTRSPATPRR